MECCPPRPLPCNGLSGPSPLPLPGAELPVRRRVEVQCSPYTNYGSLFISEFFVFKTRHETCTQLALCLSILLPIPLLIQQQPLLPSPFTCSHQCQCESPVLCSSLLGNSFPELLHLTSCPSPLQSRLNASCPLRSDSILCSTLGSGGIGPVQQNCPVLYYFCTSKAELQENRLEWRIQS